MELEKKSYRRQLSDRKLSLRVSGWKEMGHASRCGHYWVNPKRYDYEKFSIHEAEKIEYEEKKTNEEDPAKKREVNPEKNSAEKG